MFASLSLCMSVCLFQTTVVEVVLLFIVFERISLLADSFVALAQTGLKFNLCNPAGPFITFLYHPRIGDVMVITVC